MQNFSDLFNNKKYIFISLGLIVVLIILITVIVILLNSNKKLEETPQVKEITFWTRSGYINQEALNEIINNFEKENPYIKVKHEFQSDTNYKNRIFTRLKNNTGELADIIEIDELWIDELYKYLNPIQDNTIIDRYSKITIENNSVNEILYAVPFQFDSILLAYNSNFLKSKGLTQKELNKLDWTDLSIKTKEFTTTQKVKMNFSEYEKITKSGIAIGSPTTVKNAIEIIKLLLIQNNAKIYDKTNKEYMYDSKLSDVLDYYFSFSKKNIWSDEVGLDIKSFANENVYMVFVRSSDIDEIQKINPNLTFEVTITPKISIMKNISLSRSLIIPSSTLNYNESIKFLEYLTRPENGLKLYNAKSNYTFIPAQINSLNQIPKGSHFSAFSDIITTSEKFISHDDEAFNKVLENYLVNIYKRAYANQKFDKPDFLYNPKDLINNLNISLNNNKNDLQ